MMIWFTPLASSFTLILLEVLQSGANYSPLAWKYRKKGFKFMFLIPKPLVPLITN